MAILVAIMAAGFVLVRFTPVGDYFTRDEMIALLERLRNAPFSAGLLILGYVVLAPLGLPMSPLVAGGGVVFGPTLGSVYNNLGLILGAMSSYWVGKALGRDFVVHLAGPRLRRAERAFERRGFWPLVQVRFLPLPFSVIGYGAALAGVKVPLYLLTSALGIIPATTMHTYFMSTMILRPSAGIFALYMVTWGSFALLSGWPTLRESLRRRRRYRELIAERSQRRR